MSPLEPLAPDQRAVVSLVLQQGRSYDEIAALLGIPVDAVRARAQAGLAALAPANGLPGEVTAPLADYLLGQQPDVDAESTRGLLAESAPARAWASGVAGALAGVARSPLPEVPGDDAPPTEEPVAEEPPAQPAAAPGDAPPPAPRPRPVREAAGDSGPPPASKLGGVLLIAGVIAIVAVVLFLVLRSGGDDDAGQPVASGGATPTATATPTPSAQPQVADQIRLRPTGGGNAKGTMTVFLQGDQLLFALQGQNLPPEQPGRRLRGLAHRPGRQGAPPRLHEPRRRRRQARHPGPEPGGPRRLPEDVRDLRERRRVAGEQRERQAADQDRPDAASSRRGASPADSLPGFMIPAGSQRCASARSTSRPSAPVLGLEPGAMVAADRVMVRDRRAGGGDRVARRALGGPPLPDRVLGVLRAPAR